MFIENIRRIKTWCQKYQDYIYIPGRNDIKDVLRFVIKALKRSLKTTRRRLPVFSLALLAILFLINIAFSMYARVATAQSSQATQQADAQIEHATISPSLKQTAKNSPGAQVGATECPEVPDGQVLKLQDIVENIVYAVDPNNPNLTTALTSSQLSPVQLSPTVASDGATNPDSGVSQNNVNAAQADALTDCESAFSPEGVARPSDGTIILVEYKLDPMVGVEIPANCFGNLAVTMPLDGATFCIEVTGVQGGGYFPCSDRNDGTANYNIIDRDWLSGDYWNQAEDNTGKALPGQSSGYFEQTPLTEPALFPAMQAIGLAIMAPSIVMIGVQMASGMSSFRMANAMEGLSRIVLSVVLIACCYEAISLLVSVSNSLAQAIVQLHGSLSYAPVTALNDADTANPQATTAFGFYLPGDELSSYREIIMPTSRWGCAGNDFVDILGEKLASDLAGFIPFIGGILKLSLEIVDAVQVIKYAGEFIIAVMSIMLTVQVVARLVILNFYILMAPVVFGCWGLPGGLGQNVVRVWFKGFLSVLAIQVVQLFLITVAPLLLPGVPGSGTYMPSITSNLDALNLFSAFINELPSIAVLWIVLRVPKMMGTSAASAIASAGQVAGGAVVAVGAAAYQIV